MEISSDNRKLLEASYPELDALLSVIDERKAEIKDIVENLSKKTGIKATTLNKYFKTKYKGKRQETVNEAEALVFLLENDE